MLGLLTPDKPLKNITPERITNSPLPRQPSPVAELENLYEKRLAMQRQRDGVGARKFWRKSGLRSLSVK